MLTDSRQLGIQTLIQTDLTIDTPHAKKENIIFAHWGLSRNGQDTPPYQSQPFFFARE
jgi:hypothetical protein